MNWRISSSRTGSCSWRNFHPSVCSTVLNCDWIRRIDLRQTSGASQSRASWRTSTTFSAVKPSTTPLEQRCFRFVTMYTWDNAKRWIPYFSKSSSVKLRVKGKKNKDTGEDLSLTRCLKKETRFEIYFLLNLISHWLFPLVYKTFILCHQIKKYMFDFAVNQPRRV